VVLARVSIASTFDVNKRRTNLKSAAVKRRRSLAPRRHRSIKPKRKYFAIYARLQRSFLPKSGEPFCQYFNGAAGPTWTRITTKTVK